MPTWHASVAFTCASEFSADAAFDLMDELLNHGASMTTARDHLGGTITVTIDADTALDAATATNRLLHDHAPAAIGAVEIAGIEILSEAGMDAYLAEPVFPEVVGYAEIAAMGGFSRQRARQLADSAAFPKAVITTAQGPLYSKHAVERWLETRNTKPGRPAKANA